MRQAPQLRGRGCQQREQFRGVLLPGIQITPIPVVLATFGTGLQAERYTSDY